MYVINGLIDIFDSLTGSGNTTIEMPRDHKNSKMYSKVKVTRDVCKTLCPQKCFFVTDVCTNGIVSSE